MIGSMAFAAPQNTPAPAEPAANTSIPDSIRTGPTTDANVVNTPMSDESFTKAAALGNLAEVELSKIALERSRNLRVKLLADKIVEDRSSIGAQLQVVARKHNVKLPEKLGMEQQAAVSALKLQPVENFDTAYVMQVREDNVKAIALFEQAKNNAALSQELRELAGAGLKILLSSQQQTLTIEVPVRAARKVADPA
jgi:putative membrane protein